MLKPAPSQYLLSVALERGAVPGFGEYPFDIPAVRHMDVLDLHPKVTFFVGENGSGKSTLLEAIAEKLGFSMENWSYGGKSLHEQSHGESFFATLVNRLGGHGIYLFDEPEAALSPQRQMSLLVRMHDLIGDFSQFIIATHSPILMAYPDAWIYQFSEDGIQRVEYEDTEHYQITSRFMRDPKGMMRRLLGTDEELTLGP